MRSKRQSGNDSAVPRAPGEKRAAGQAGSTTPPRPRSKKRLYVLLALLLVVSGVLIGKWFYEKRALALPEPPTLALDALDPEVAEELTRARALVVQEPRSIKSWAQLALFLDAYQFADEAIVCYQAAEVLEKSNWVWPYLRALLLVKTAYPEEALPCLERAAHLAPDPMARLKLADCLFSLGRVADAAEQYQRVLAGDAKNVRALLGLANVAGAREDFQTSLRHLETVSQDPHLRKRACALRAAAHERLGNRQEAAKERALYASLPADEPWPDIHWQFHELRKGMRGRILRAEALRSKGKPGEAAALLVDTVAMYPQSDQAWAALGVAKEITGDFAGAEQAYEKSIALAPQRADHRFALGDFLQTRQRFKEAAAAFQKAIELAPVEANAYFRLGECLQAIGDRAAAVRAYRQALDLNPELARARDKLAQLNKK
jgi:tetratricopeptide (TPR) repeat protein